MQVTAIVPLAYTTHVEKEKKRMRHPDWQFWRHSKWRLLKWTLGLIGASVVGRWLHFADGCELGIYFLALVSATVMAYKFRRDLETAKHNYSPGEDGAWYDHSLLDAPGSAQHTDGIFNPGSGPTDSY